MDKRIIDLTLQGLSDKKISEITGLSVKKVHEVNAETRAEIYKRMSDEMKRLKQEGRSLRQIAKIMGVSYVTVYNYTIDTPYQRGEDEFKREWNAVCRRLNPRAWEGR